MAFVAATFVRLCGYLQDPRLVANFQRTMRRGGDLLGEGGDHHPVEGRPPQSSPIRIGRSTPGRGTHPGTRRRRWRRGRIRRTTGPGTWGTGLRVNLGVMVFIVRNRLLFYLFTFGTELGNEMFFIAFFPFLFWNVDALVGRRLIVVWAWNLFLGQSTKDLVRWSRPASPPVVKVEVFYNSEYSMPSTHAMTGTAIPFSLFLLSCGRWEYSFSFGLSVALAWSLLVCVSRVYMGMHSVLEVITGFLYSLLILAVLQPMLDAIDGFYATHPLAPLAIVLSHVGMGLLAFSLDSWSTSRGDTAQALGTGVGTALGTHVNHRLGLLTDPPLSALPLAVPAAGFGLVGRSLARFVLGVAVLLVCRMVMKAVTIPGLCRVFGIPAGDVRSARQHMRVELPYRYIVYSAVGFCCVSVVPFVFGMVNLA
ncbi:Sphingosine-1-phosphate phosphatase 1 [Merluccius polli]|uniref:Sphingosine-1-phosphate phosphatase 1 n=1 Tax=Merluccius polli TaxID=89951 RepID=A0AA47MXN5_MERPO|nr:Sphingosine-1-phosphate phosphatase 1 [Merluccius polli]